MDKSASANDVKDEDDDVFEISPQSKQDSDEADDIDDIELVFTTAETDSVAINEKLVPIIEEVRRKSLHTILVETDISKCGVSEESDIDIARRNTLPVVTPYRPIAHREVLGLSKVSKGSKGPVRVHKQESGAQTDLTALPEHSKSETYLARKISSNLTTLPSKFTLPVPRSKKLPINDKTREERRVLLSDINFTSMVPELSRSADHLHKDDKSLVRNLCSNYPGAFEYMKRIDSCYYQDKNRSSWGSYYGSRCQSFSCHCHEEDVPRRRYSWRQPMTPCCHSSKIWSSVPGSPTRCTGVPRSESTCHPLVRRPPPVMYHHCYPHVHPGCSLPDLRDVDSESTDSLVDEAELFLRKHVDSLMTTRRFRNSNKWSSDVNIHSDIDVGKPISPFLPRTDKDLKPGDIVKVIAAESRVVLGIVRYSGPVEGKTEPYVGVELPKDTGISDGTFLGHRYFNCKQDHGIFVPFKKVVIAWNH